MKATGIVRRIDDLGRVVIPKEIRRNCRIREGDPLEIFTDQVDGQPVVCFRKYDTGFLNSLTALADTINDEMMDTAFNEQRIKVRKHFNEIAKILKEWEDEG
jgi:AbrB family transcriptional regulator (stage V sporulation protein T)